MHNDVFSSRIDSACDAHRMNRRNVLLGASAMLAAERPGAAFATPGRPLTYIETVAQVWRPLDPAAGVREVVRAGTLAANSHNTQPWRFTVTTDRITIEPDLSRPCPAVDSDDHHLFASLGCAIENMVLAAPTMGLRAAPDLIASDTNRIAIEVAHAPAARSALADAITQRQCTRGIYDGRGISPEELRLLDAAGTLEGVECRLVTERPHMEAILDYVVQGNTAQMRDPAFMTELKSWIRYNDSQAIEHLDGLSARASGNPSLPAWLARRLLPFVMTERGENGKYVKQIRSSAGIAVFSSAANDKAHWITAGRAYQRFALQATALSIRHAFINQPVEVAALRPQLTAYLGLGSRRPDLVVRFGRGPSLPQSLRRPIEAVVNGV